MSRLQRIRRIVRQVSRIRDESAAVLAAAAMKSQQIQMLIDELSRAHRESAAILSVRPGEAFDIPSIRAVEVYRAHLRRRSARASVERVRAEVDVARARERTEEAHRKVKIWENLLERVASADLDENVLRDAHEIDELASLTQTARSTGTFSSPFRPAR